MNQGRLTDRIVVVHSAPVWLPQTETWLFQQARHLPAGVELHVACDRTENLDQFSLPSVHSSSTARLRLPRGGRGVGPVGAVARRFGASLLHSHFGPTGWRNRDVARRRDLVHAVSFYGYDVQQVPRTDPAWNARYRALFEDVALVLCEGPFLAESVVALGCPREKVRVHHLGVDVASISHRRPEWAPGQPLRVLMAAAFREKKGLPVALAAVGEFIRGGGDARVTIIGDALSSPESAREKLRIQRVIADYGLSDRARLLGFQPHDRMLAEAALHDVFLSPSITASDGDTEGGAPVALIEMAAAGLVVVSTTHCDIPEVVQHAVSGLLAPESDSGTLARHLHWLVDHPERWPEMTGLARARIEAEFDAVRQGLRLALHYEEALEKRRKRGR